MTGAGGDWPGPASPSAGGRSTATVLFTDLVASTERWSRLSDGAAASLRRTHDRLLAEAVSFHQGRVVKGLGDGIMATFSGAADAVDAAVAIQRAFDRHNRSVAEDSRLDSRLGISSGDVSVEAGDCFGAPVVEAARLCQSANGGQILVSQVVRLLVGAQAGYRFSGIGMMELKGLPAPVEASEVEWAPEAGLFLPLPASIERAAATFRFVGRRAELDRLLGAWGRALTGGRTAVLVGGEPGIGKTRLMAEMALSVHPQGAVVLYGRCEEEPGVPYQPFAEALGRYVAACPAADLVDQLGPLGGEVARLVPGLPARVPGLDEPFRAEPETERYRLLEAVRDFIGGIARSTPVLLLLDDLQWAGKPTLLLLRHLLRAGEGHRLTVVATFRDSDVTRSSPLAQTLADLRREPDIERLSLKGLDEGETTALIEAATGHPLDAEDLAFAHAVHSETEGNPFFVGELLRHLAETGAVIREEPRWKVSRPLSELGIPEGVREVVGRRLARLRPAANDVLSLAAVIGREFDVGLLAAAGDLTRDVVLDSLEEAEEARLVAATSGRAEHYAFAHALVRSALYEEIPGTRRLRLHLRIGEVIESRPDADAHITELAHHFSEAAGLGEIVRAVDYARRAGDRAREGLAFEEAASYYERALASLELEHRPDEVLRCELQIGLGDALTRAGDKRRRTAFAAAAETARALGDPRRLAEVALARNVMGHVSTTGAVREDIVAQVEEALAGLGKEDSVLRARLLGVLAVELTWTRQHERRGGLSRDSLDMARRLGDRATLARVLGTHHHAAFDPDNLEERLEVAGELIVLGEDLGDAEAVFLGHLFRHEDLIEQGDVSGARAALDAAERVANELRHPVFRWHVAFRQAAHVLLAGRLEDAETLAGTARIMGQEGGVAASGVEGVFGCQLYLIGSEQGRFDAAEAALAQLVETQPGLTSWRALLARTLVEQGRPADARDQFELLAGDDFALVLRGAAWLAPMVVLGGLAVDLDDRDNAAVLYRRLLPYAGRSAWGDGPGSFGPVDLALGRLSAALGSFGDAEGHFAASSELCERMGSPIWGARTMLGWAEMLRTRGEPDDAGRARQLAGAAQRSAEATGQMAVAGRARVIAGS
ncbi:MAG: ATP-binding protein [Acidimicrobiia bacterium]